ncbi:MAG TPA: MotA/TolQ/ExbB proton channel family protein [Verrucomicrobiota bacterium]|nr:MotA/TolQ/ExbB proton channel family protein [Verrucomicrobiota bacterium]
MVYIWQQATLETKLVLFVLAIMSVFAWSVMTSKTLQMRRARKLNRIFLEEYRNQKKVLDIFERNVRVEGCPLFNIYREACAVVKARLHPVQPPASNPPPASTPYMAPQPVLSPQPSSMGPITTMSLDAGQTMPLQLSSPVPQEQSQPQLELQPQQMQISIKTIEHIKRNMERTVSEEALTLESGLIMLAIAVSGSPFLGLLGTVWGVMSAFSYVAVAQSADLATMAPGVAGALVATVGGLLVAIPSMFGYNWLVHNLRVFTVEMDNFAQDLVSKIETEFLLED